MPVIAWGITGAGAFLRESIETIMLLTARGFRITAFVSRAARNVLLMYGLLDELESKLKGPYPMGVVFEDEEAPGFPSTGRLYKHVYDLVVVSPATMNTVGKIVNGIADSLVSNLVMHAIKNNIKVLILPVDLYESRSTIPILIDRDKCAYCDECVAASVCPTGALRRDEYYKVKVDVSKCTRCLLCREACRYGAIMFDVEVVVKPHPFYTGIIRRLSEIPGVEIVDHPRRIMEKLGIPVEDSAGHGETS